MGQITPSFMYDLESNMRLITAREYERLLSNLWWNKIAKVMPSGAKKERINWLLDSAKIRRVDSGADVTFEDILSRTTEFENEFASAGLELQKEELEDLDGNGVQLATHWARQMGAYAAYWPQKMVATAIRANPTTYDGLAFFHTAHPLNPYNTGLGTFANLFTGSSSGAYPGALKIDESVDLETAVQNVVKAIAYIASIKMANGEDPRMLRVANLVVPPALVARAQQITKAKFLASAVGSAGGTADYEAVIRNFGFGEPIEATELGSGFSGGSDTSWYITARDITADELGAFVYVDREAFSIVYHGPQTDADLARKRAFQWTNFGRNTVGPGHPYLFFRADAS